MKEVQERKRKRVVGLGLADWWIPAGLGQLPPQSPLPASSFPLTQTAAYHGIIQPGSWCLGLRTERKMGSATEGPLPPTLREDTPTGCQQHQAAGLGLGSLSS